MVGHETLWLGSSMLPISEVMKLGGSRGRRWMGKRISTRWTCLRAICSEWISWMISFIFWCPQIQHCPHPPALSPFALTPSPLLCRRILSSENEYTASRGSLWNPPKSWGHGRCLKGLGAQMCTPRRQTAPRKARKQAAIWECVDPTQQTSNSHRVDVFVMGGLPTRGQLPRRKRHSARWLFVL